MFYFFRLPLPISFLSLFPSIATIQWQRSTASSCLQPLLISPILVFVRNLPPFIIHTPTISHFLSTLQRFGPHKTLIGYSRLSVKASYRSFVVVSPIPNEIYWRLVKSLYGKKHPPAQPQATTRVKPRAAWSDGRMEEDGMSSAASLCSWPILSLSNVCPLVDNHFDVSHLSPTHMHHTHRSQSRMREPFLFYEEKVQTTAEEKQAKADRRARKASSSDSQAASASLLPVRRQDRPSKPDGLTKQTYSCECFIRFPSAPTAHLVNFTTLPRVPFLAPCLRLQRFEHED